jgi:multiple sugar transport system permease protein
VVGTFWKYFFEPQYGIFNQIVNAVAGLGSFTMLGDTDLSPWAIVIVDTWMWTPYVMLLLLAGLRSIPPYLYEAAEIDRASSWTTFWRITLPMVMPFLVLALLFRTIENFKMFDLVDQLTNGGPGSVTELASITLKREAFEKWRTGYASALAIILFVAIYGLSLITVRFLERMKQR